MIQRCLEEPPALGERRGDELGKEPGFPHARLPNDGHELPVPSACPL